MSNPKTPAEALLRQRDQLTAAVARLTAALAAMPEPGDDVENGTWADVASHAHLIDALRRAELI